MLHIHDLPRAALMKAVDPDPGAVRVDALSGQAAGRAQGRRRRRQAADPAQLRGGAAGAGRRRGPCRHRRRAHRRVRARGFGGSVLMTSPRMPQRHRALRRSARPAADDVDLVVNFQGDALLTPPGFVTALIARMADDPRRAGRDPGDAPAQRRSARAAGRGSRRAGSAAPASSSTARAARSISRSG